MQTVQYENYIEEIGAGYVMSSDAYGNYWAERFTG